MASNRDLGTDVSLVMQYVVRLRQQAEAAASVAPDTGSPSPSRWNPAKRATDLRELADALAHVCGVAAAAPAAPSPEVEHG